jgi:hypothetical protein
MDSVQLLTEKVTSFSMIFPGNMDVKIEKKDKKCFNANQKKKRERQSSGVQKFTHDDDEEEDVWARRFSKAFA